MKHPRRTFSPLFPPGPPYAPADPNLRTGLELLREAYQLAEKLRCTAWEFATSLGTLRDAGLTTTALRWLVCTGHVEHALEKDRGGRGPRVFGPKGHLHF